MSVLVVDKPVGPTSFAVVQRAQRGLRKLWGADARGLKLGHGGTLDPAASGVLPVCIGEATKLAPFLLDADKAYDATMRLGAETDTMDADGRVVASPPVPPLTAADVERAMERFRGAIDQVPPMYSALKREGRPLYEYARAGATLALEPRRVVIHELRLVSFTPPDEIAFHVCSSKGTYVRALASDLGRALGTGAHLTALRRVRSGPFAIEQAVTLETFEAQVSAGVAPAFVPLADALAHLPAVAADEALEVALSQGKKVPWESLGAGPVPRARVLREDGTLLAVAEPRPDGTVRTLRVFNRAPRFFAVVG